MRKLYKFLKILPMQMLNTMGFELFGNRFGKFRAVDDQAKLRIEIYGAAKSSFNTQSKQRVLRWNDGDVKIKLKMIEAKGQFKMAFYYFGWFGVISF